jgi:hypothetical protein
VIDTTDDDLIDDRFNTLIRALTAGVRLVEEKVRAAQGDDRRTLRLVEARLALEDAFA